jgi:hypothetical protein
MSQEILQNALKKEKLEELLVANWTQFIDSSKLMAFVLQKVQKNQNQFAIINGKKSPTGMRITISHFYPSVAGFVFWVEFIIPLEINKTAEGTMELSLSHTGNITHIKTLGNIFC